MDIKFTALIIEPRKHKALSFVLNNMLKCLSKKWEIIIFHGKNNGEYVRNIIDNKLVNINSVNQGSPCFNCNKIRLVKLDVDNLNQKTYSELLANSTIIYNQINTEYFLIFQTDSMMFQKHSYLLEHFLNGDYDYIGAPWLICNYEPTKTRDFIGNGGFSLRKKSTMLKIMRNHKWDENNEWQEDLFFTKNYEGIYVKKPAYELAKYFCVDEVFSDITMACHRPWSHSFFPDLVKLYPECQELRDLQSEE